jgi:hypothetical protein
MSADRVDIGLPDDPRVPQPDDADPRVSKELGGAAPAVGPGRSGTSGQGADGSASHADGSGQASPCAGQAVQAHPVVRPFVVTDLTEDVREWVVRAVLRRGQGPERPVVPLRVLGVAFDLCVEPVAQEGLDARISQNCR